MAANTSNGVKKANRLDFMAGPVQHERQKAGGSQQSYFRRQAGQVLFHPDACVHDHHDTQKHANGRLFPQGDHSGGIQRYQYNGHKNAYPEKNAEFFIHQQMNVVNPPGTERNAQQVKSTGSNGNRLRVVRGRVEETEKEEHRRKQQDFDADQKRRQQRENDNVPQEPGRADGGTAWESSAEKRFMPGRKTSRIPIKFSRRKEAPS